MSILKIADPYASHLPILESVFRLTDIKYVFEFGTGFYSTKFFENRAAKTISIELSSIDWADKIRETVSENKVKVLYYQEINKALSDFANEKNIDLVFVDGSAESRKPCIEAAFEKCKVIVVHDTESCLNKFDMYHFADVKKVEGYYWIDVMAFYPWTSVLTKDEKISNGIMCEYAQSRARWIA